MSTDTLETTNQSLETPENREQTHEPTRFVTPRVDIYEKEGALAVEAELPGLNPDDLNISVEKSVLTIKANPPKGKDRQYRFREFRPTGFYRQFQLGEQIDQEKITADYRNGILYLTLPYAEKQLPRKIEVAAN